MARKIPAEYLPQLREVLETGTLPEWGEPGHEVIDEVWGEQLLIVQDAWRRPKAVVSRRHISALWDLWGDVCTDGLTVGVAINEPGLAAAALEAATAMKLKIGKSILAKVARCVPEEVSKLRSVDKRLDWYNSRQGAPMAAKLEKLDERINEPDFLEEIQWAIFRRIVAEAGEFFEK